MNEPIAVLCRIGRKRWTHGRGGVRRKMIEILPVGEKERGEIPDDADTKIGTHGDAEVRNVRTIPVEA